MLAKMAETNGKNWDEKLPFVLFAYYSCSTINNNNNQYSNTMLFNYSGGHCHATTEFSANKKLLVYPKSYASTNS